MNAAIASQDKHSIVFLQFPYLVQSNLFIQGVFKEKKNKTPLFSNYQASYTKVYLLGRIIVKL